MSAADRTLDRNPVEPARLIAGFVAVFALFQLLAHALGSDRGQAGPLIAAAVIAALVAIECCSSDDHRRRRYLRSDWVVHMPLGLSSPWA